MSCVIRVNGTDLDADALMNQLVAINGVKPYRVTRRGDQAGPVARMRGMTVSPRTSFLFDVPTLEFGPLSIQSEAISAFLRLHRDTFSIVSQTPGVQEAYVDVAIQLSSGVKFPLQDQALDLTLIKLLAEIGLAFRLSLWLDGSETYVEARTDERL